MKKFYLLIILYLFFSAIGISQNFSPKSIPSLTLWLRADSLVNYDLNNKIDTWGDCSGKGYIATQGTTSSKPLLVTNALNNKSVIKFDGIDDYLLGSAITNFGDSSLTMFIIASGDTTASSDAAQIMIGAGTGIWVNRNVNNNYRNFMVLSNTNFATSLQTSQNSLPLSGYNYKIFIFSKELNTVSKLYFNGNLQASSTDAGQNGTFTNANYFIGYNNDAYQSPYKGKIAEIILYKRLLSPIERMKVEQYLNVKYAQQINLGPDINIAYGFPSITLDAGSGFTNYSWNTGSTNQVINLNRSGKYWVSASDLFEYTSSDTVFVTFPNTKLNHNNDTSFCLGNSFVLKSMITNKKKYNFTWYNNGNQISTDSSIIVSDSGRYCVAIQDTLGNTVSSDTIHVTVDRFAEKVNIGPISSPFCSGNSIRISPPLPTSGVYDYDWFDGTSHSHDSVLVIIADGFYRVKVTNQQGCFGKDSINIVVDGTAPTTNFIADTVCFGEVTHFTDLSTFDPLDTVNKWHWDLYLNDTSSQKNPSYLFPTAGTHSVKLTNYTQGGCSNFIYKNILVNPSPNANFTVTVACIGNPYQFNNSSSPAIGDSITGYYWDFGDGVGHSSLKNPQYTYSVANTYNVSLTITTKKGCQKSIIHQLNVVNSYPHPVAPIAIYPANNAVIGDTNISFNWSSSVNAIKYEIVIAADSNFSVGVESHILDTVGYTKYFNNYSQSVYWKVIAYNICSNLTSSQRFNFDIFSPNDFPGLNLWLKADGRVDHDQFGLVSKWADESGNNNNVIQSNLSFKPKLINGVLNGKPAIKFDGNDDRMAGSIIAGIDNSSLTCFIVAAGDTSTSADAAQIILGVGNSFWICRNVNNLYNNFMVLNNTTFFSSIQTSQNSLPITGYGYRIFEYTKEIGTESALYFNGNLQVTSTDITQNSAFTNDNYFIGYNNASYQQPYKGKIAEIILYDNVLADSSRVRIQNYLYAKYAGPPVDLGPDIVVNYGLCPVILDAGGRFTNYLWSTGDTTQTISVQNSGTYTVTATNYFGIQSTDSVKVTKPSIVINDTAFCLNSTVTINSGLNHKYNFLWSDMSTDSILTINTPGTYWVLVSDTISSCVLTDTFNVVADSFPAKVSLGPDRNICSGELLGLTEGASEAILYFWSNGSGNSVIVIPDQVGTCPYYSVTVTNHNSCIGIDTVHLCVTGVKPDVNFSFDSVCFGSPTHFWDASSVVSPDSINGRKWMFFDNDSSYLLNPSHIFSHDGVFNVQLNVTSKLGCNTSFVKPVTVFSIPKPDFIPLLGCSMGPTSFSDRASCDYGNIVKWHWAFDDPGSGGNDTSFQENPIHNFDNSGTYSVLQRVVTNIGCHDSIRKDVFIKSSPPADYSSTTTCIGKETYFADQTIVPPQNEILEWHWKFGDGDSSTLKNPAHLYTSSGYFTAVMKVKSINGCWGAMTKNIKIHAMPEAAFSTAGSCLTFGTQFTDNTVVFDDTITQWIWQFDNGQTSNLQNPLYVYPDTGVYNVSLNVKSNAGCQDSIVSAIEVHSLPTAQFTFSPEYGESPLDVNFYNQSLRGSSYLWNFGDGTGPSTDQNPVHIYNSNGVYKITLTTYNIYNCVDTVSYYVFVMPSYSDIMVKSVNAEIKDNKLQIKAELKNVGSRRLKHLELSAHVGNENSIIEDWNGVLSPGESMIYEFSAKFYVSSQQNLEYVCVYADVKDDNTEINKSDNEACAVFTDDFSVQNPYPNPANNMIYLTYIVPFEDIVDIKLYDSKGALVYTVFSGTANQGFNKIKLDISLLSQGVFAYKITFRDKIKTGRFVKH